MSGSARTLLALTLVLSLIGLLFVFEASVAESFDLFNNQYFFLQQQAKWWGLGMVTMLVTTMIPSTFWQKLGPLIYILSVGLLVAVIIPGLSPEINGAHRWLFVGGFRLQPVELLKLGIVTFFAQWLSKHQRLGPFLCLTLLPAGLLMLQPDLGSCLVVLAITFGMYFISGADLKIISGLAMAGIIGLVVLILISPYRLQRVTTYLNPEQDPLGSSFHIRQITLALGNGGLLGQGIGQSRQKYSYIPEASSDSIFAIVAEELGWTGATVIMILFGLYGWIGYRIAHLHKPQTYEHLLAMGIVIWITTQSLLNIAAVVALVPLTGLPLPFISYGGSSLVMVLSATGILAGTGKKRS